MTAQTTVSAEPTSRPGRGVAAVFFDALGSYWLAITLLSFLFLLTVVGTVEQANTSLFQVQKDYFESAFVLHDVGPIKVPLPGVYLLLVVLGVNLVVGGVIRIRKSRQTWGVLVAHLGILVLLGGAAVEAEMSDKGYTRLAEGASSDEFVSYHDWEITIAKPSAGGPMVEHLVPGEQFMKAREGRRATFTSPEIPFDLDVLRAYENCVPSRPGPETGPPVDGVALHGLPRDPKNAELDRAGVYVTVRPKDGSPARDGILWADENYPMSVLAGGARWTIGLGHRRWKMPFTIRLEDFRREMHPGLEMPKSYESDVTKVDGGTESGVRISMNKPLRDRGYTLFQSSFNEPMRPGDPWYSIFSVVRNPADDVPLIACTIITVGLLGHFLQKLLRHIRNQSRRPA